MQKSLVIDTGTWMKLQKLLELKFINNSFIFRLYEFGKIIITPEIALELDRQNVSSWDKNRTFIIPVENDSLKLKAMEDGFDEADASIFGLSHVSKMIILTEDRPLLKYAMMYGLNFLHFADFLAILAKNELLSKNNLYRFVHQLYDLRNIGKKRLKKYKKLAQNL
ncbi:MAG: hypothetical protein ACTSVU_00610 [Promethearchaeota archaeon]